MRLAKALDVVGKSSEAAKQFDACLNGPLLINLRLGLVQLKQSFITTMQLRNAKNVAKLEQRLKKNT